MNKDEKKFIDKVITQDLMKYITTILIGCKGETPYNGSIVLVDTGKRKFGITAHHVLEGFQKEFEKDSDCVMQIGRTVIDPNERLISFSKKLDIATFDLNDVETQEISIGGKQIGTTYFKPPTWPPEPPVIGERITICGFPSRLKFQEGDKWYYVTCTIGAQEIHGVNEDTFTVQFERNIWYYIGGEIDSKVPQNIGGISGGPVFLLKNLTDFSKIFSFTLIGINQEHHEEYDIMYISRLDCINDLGEIRA